MGIDSASQFDPSALSTTLGTQGVHPLEMAQAYSVLPNDGVLKRARFVTKIVGPDGKVIYQNSDAGHRVLDPNVARGEISLLEDVVKFGTASGTLSGFPRPIAGKTGTTDNNVDAWFVGFTPQYTAAVWMGDPNGEEPMVGLPGGAVQGATYPARIWRQFMFDATANLPPLNFLPYDPNFFPPPSFINEFGRRGSSYCCRSDNSSRRVQEQPVFPVVPAAPPPPTKAHAPPTTVQQSPPTTVKKKRRHKPPPTTVPKGP
jgi:penicillin-binding protein 1A